MLLATAGNEMIRQDLITTVEGQRLGFLSTTALAAAFKSKGDLSVELCVVMFMS